MINYTKLARVQKQLDEKINYNGTDRLKNKFIALRCECWEMYNETKDFKFWSTRYKEEDRQKLLIEGVDVLHFILSIGNEIGYVEQPLLVKQDVMTPYVRLKTILRMIDGLEKSMVYMDSDLNFINFRELLSHYLLFMLHYDFTFEDIERAYMIKNEEKESEGKRVVRPSRRKVAM